MWAIRKRARDGRRFEPQSTGRCRGPGRGAVRSRCYRGSGAVGNAIDFQAYRGTEPPRFANRMRAGVRQDPRLLRRSPGSTSRARSCSSATPTAASTSAFTPDFYLPEQDLYLEVTVMKQSLVTRKNRKLRELRELYPDVRVKLFYRRDIERLAQRYRLSSRS